MPKHDAMKEWYRDEHSRDRTDRALTNSGFIWYSLAFSKAGANYNIHDGVDHEPKDDEMGCYAKVESDLQEASKSMDPAASCAYDFILAAIPR